MWVIHRSFVRSPALALGLLLAGCGSDEATALHGAPVGAELPRFGLVALESNFPSMGRDTPALADAFFWRATNEADSTCALLQVLDGCEISECVAGRSAATDSGFAWVSGGNVDIAGTKLDFGFAERQPGWYEASLPSLNLALWEGGETVTAKVNGSAEFPPLALSLSAPRPVLLTTPVIAESSEQGVDPNADLVFAWRSPTAGAIYVDVDEQRAGPVRPRAERSARCELAAHEGRGVVSARVFAALSAPEALSGYRFHVSTNAESEVSAGRATFRFSAWSQSFDWIAPLRTQGLKP